MKDYYNAFIAWKEEGENGTLNFRVPIHRLSQSVDLDEENKYNINKALEGSLDQLIKLRNLAKANELPLQQNDGFILGEVISILEEQHVNRRGLDPFTCLFQIHINLFELAQKNVKGFSRRKALRSNEVIWAVQSEQKKALIDFCLPKEKLLNDGFLTWERMSQLCVPLWYDDSQELKNIVEKLAMMVFKTTKNADDVLLWYVLLDKINVLIPLYRMSGNNKMIGFLSNDFNEDRWRTAAQKNAFVLLGQKRYTMAISFFLLGGSLDDAIAVTLDHLKDLMLAILFCRLKEEVYSQDINDKPILKNIFQKYFVEKGREVGDFWLASIGYSLQGKHVESINCISEILEENKDLNNEDAARIWDLDYFPIRSGYHPSIKVLVDMLKDSFKVKREIEISGNSQQDLSAPGDFDEFVDFDDPFDTPSLVQDVQQSNEPKKELIINKAVFRQRALTFFYYYRTPLLGIATENRDSNKEEFGTLQMIMRLTYQYIDQVLVRLVATGDWKSKFPLLHEELGSIAKLGFITLQDMYSFIESKLVYLKTPKLIVAWHLSRGNINAAMSTLDSLSLEVGY